MRKIFEDMPDDVEEEMRSSIRERTQENIGKAVKTLLEIPWEDWGTDFIQVKRLLCPKEVVDNLYDYAYDLNYSRCDPPFGSDDYYRGLYGVFPDLGASYNNDENETGWSWKDEEGWYYTWMYVREYKVNGWVIVRSKERNIIKLIDILVESAATIDDVGNIIYPEHWI